MWFEAGPNQQSTQVQVHVIAVMSVYSRWCFSTMLAETHVIINPWHACTARVTILVSVCLSVYPSVFLI